MQITKLQLGRLQTLYSQLARHEIGVGLDRESRLRWATERLRKPVSSFSNLSIDDAGFLINGLQGTLGVKAPLKNRPDRDQARRAGMDGRKDGAEFAAAPQLATSADLARVRHDLDQLAWTEDQFRTFLASSRSPLAKRADKQVRTAADANKVYWALKRIAQSKGAWKKASQPQTAGPA
jgi:hypothetical protein